MVTAFYVNPLAEDGRWGGPGRAARGLRIGGASCLARMSSRKAAKWLSGNAGTSAVLLALPEVFPWVRHLDAEEVREFTVELLEALSDAAEPGAGEAVHRAIVSWRATARIDADPDPEPDPDQLREALRPLGGVDLGPAEAHE